MGESKFDGAAVVSLVTKNPLWLFAGQSEYQGFAAGVLLGGHDLPGEFIPDRVFFIHHERCAGRAQMGTGDG